MSRQQNARSGPKASGTGANDRTREHEDSEKNMWSSMLDSVSSGKKLPEKNLIILGGTTESQKDFLETLASDNAPRRPQDRHRRKPPTANEFALGYTYQDVLDADHEDLLARLSIYFLSDPSPAFVPLAKPLLNPKSIPESLVIILLDWVEPWRWIRQLRDWVRFLRTITSDLSMDAQEAADTTMKEWQQRRRGRPSNDTGGATSGSEPNVTIPLGQGEWDEPLGLPLSVVCHRADKIDALETQHGWREEEFDYVLQFLRTVLLKHGSSLIYTSVSAPNSLPTLIHSSLGIQSLLKKQTLKHNVIDRDKILVPPNWDSWGKIRVLREGFNVESISSGWSTDIEAPLALAPAKSSDEVNGTVQNHQLEPGSPIVQGTVTPIYEETIRNPRQDYSNQSKFSKATIEIQPPSMQSFLATQAEVMEKLKKDEEAAAAAEAKGKPSEPPTTRYQDSGAISDQIGPVQFNMGGIQVDADDMLQRLKNRDAKSETPTPNTQTPSKGAGPDMKGQNEQLANFFAGLMKKDRTGSPRGERTTTS